MDSLVRWTSPNPSGLNTKLKTDTKMLSLSRYLVSTNSPSIEFDIYKPLKNETIKIGHIESKLILQVNLFCMVDLEVLQKRASNT